MRESQVQGFESRILIDGSSSAGFFKKMLSRERIPREGIQTRDSEA